MKKYNFNVGTKFQKIVWNLIANIPEGKVVTYQELAIKIGQPKSSRAVASACGKNPYIPEIPCHRVVRKDGRLGGYSAEGGIKRKNDFVYDSKDFQYINYEHKSEWTLIRKLLKFDEVIISIEKDLMPNRLCNYLFELCQTFNRFNDQVPILKEEKYIKISL